MGIPGLTTFIHNHANQYLEPYELHDCNLVIDANSLAHQLYAKNCTTNECFNGDYDKYARSVFNFFRILSECNITAIAVFDGGYEQRKATTIFKRMRNKIDTANSLNATSEGYCNVFPLFISELFKDIVRQLKIRLIQCDFEADSETASLAKTLNCPVLSCDSDYFIFDADYIPYDFLSILLRRNRQKSHYYMACRIFLREKFVKRYKGLTGAHLPLFATLSGNDYVNKQVFNRFFRVYYLKNSQDRFKPLLYWLQHETVKSAIEKVVNCYPQTKRKAILSSINGVIDGYSLKQSNYVNDFIENGNLAKPNCETGGFDEVFVERFRKGDYPTCFMDMLYLDRCYCVPQVENSAEMSAYSVCFDIIAAIYKILTGSDSKQIACYARSEGIDIKRYYLPVCELNLPKFQELQHLPDRKKVFLTILELDDDFLQNCPPSWHIFLITIKYLINKSILQLPHVYSLCLCAIFLNYVDPLVGYCRSTKLFTSKYSTVLETLEIRRNLTKKSTILEAIDDIQYNDALFCSSDLINYFQMDLKMRQYNRMFNRNVVHVFAQFQCALLYVKHLNALLYYPFENFLVSNFYDGTFLYNMTVNLFKKNVNTYFESFLNKSLTVVNLLKLFVSKDLVGDLTDEVKMVKRKRKKKPKKIVAEEIEQIEDNIDNSDDEEVLFDPNNRYSVLRI